MRRLLWALIDWMSFGCGLRIGPWLFVNAKLAQTFALDRGQVRFVRDWFRLTSPDTAEAHYQTYLADRAQNWARTPVIDISDTVGQPRSVAISASRWRFLEIWIFADVTHALDDAYQGRILFDELPHPAFIFDEKGVRDCNEATVRLLEYDSRDEIIGLHPLDLSPEKQPDGTSSADETARIRVLVFERGHCSFDWLHKRADGSTFMTEVQLRSLELPTGRVLLSVWTDVDARCRSQAELEESKREVERSLAARKSFLATMSHELRTPMNGVLGLTDSMLEEGGLSDEQTRTLHAIQTSGHTLRQLLDDILDFSKFEAGELRLESLDFDLEALGAEVVALHASSARARGVRVHWQTEGVGPIRRGDPTRVRQMLANLVSNAVKFTEAGEVGVSAELAPGHFVLRVRDTGLGMSPEQTEHIFEPFRQGDGSTTRRFGGTGLGLSIVKKLLEAMQGELHLESTPGEGSCFTLRLPMPECADESSASIPRAEVTTPARMPKRILVAEDVRVNQLVLKKMLAQRGVELRFVEDGAQVLEAVEAKPPDLILMDIHMPRMNGLEATRRLRERGVGCPIIAVTASCLDEELSACTEAGMNEVVSKPVDRERLFEVLARWAASAGDGVEISAPVGKGARRA